MSFERRRGAGLQLPRLALPSPRFLKGPVARGALVTVATFFIGYLLAANWLFPAAEDPTDATFIDVPDLSGLEQEEGEGQATELGLAVVVATSIHHPRLLSGTIVAQAPLPGQVARPGDTVHVTLSSGPEARIVPELGGLAGPEAARLLRALGFEVEVTQRRQPGAGAGVIETEPAAGTRLYVPANVLLVVSEGAPIVDVPDLLGRHVDDIATILEEAELQMGAIRFQPDAPEAPGRVVSQSPAAGSSLRGGGFVTVVVAGAPPDSMAADIAEGDILPPPGDTSRVSSGGR